MNRILRVTMFKKQKRSSLLDRIYRIYPVVAKKYVCEILRTRKSKRFVS
jgi:hypothetical protein